jgi:orotidine-5'-phosphate decarboxylase
LNFDAHPRSSLIVALDFDSLNTAVKFAKQVADLVGMFKIGSQLFTAAGPAAIKEISALGPGIFLDLKFHDIPNTVAGAVLSAAAMTGVQLVNVHALGGSAMLHAAAQAVSAGVPMGADRPRLLAVTVLTSMDSTQISAVGLDRAPAAQVDLLARMGIAEGIRGFVCSPQEVRTLRALTGPEGILVIPGIRPVGTAIGDQKRVATPAEALRQGASHLVVGRPITHAPDPVRAATAILAEMAESFRDATEF